MKSKSIFLFITSLLFTQCLYSLKAMELSFKNERSKLRVPKLKLKERIKPIYLKKGLVVEIKNSNFKYILIRSLGIGSFGEVWKALPISKIDMGGKRNPVALKFSKIVLGESRFTVLANETNMHALNQQKEAQLMIKLRNEFELYIKSIGQKYCKELNPIVPVKRSHMWLGFKNDKNDIYRHIIVMKYANGGSLADKRKQKIEKKLSLLEIKEVAAKISVGLCFLYRVNVLHGDIKSENILLHESKMKKYLWITDFGLSQIILKNNIRERNFEIQSLPNRSPEVYLGLKENINLRCDLFSFGCCLFKLYKGETLFPLKKCKIELSPNANLAISHMALLGIPSASFYVHSKLHNEFLIKRKKKDKYIYKKSIRNLIKKRKIQFSQKTNNRFNPNLSDLVGKVSYLKGEWKKLHSDFVSLLKKLLQKPSVEINFELIDDLLLNDPFLK